MRFYEFEAKRVLARHGIPVPPGGTAAAAAEAEKLAAELGCPVYVKAQVFSRRRSKAGAVEVAATPADAAKAASKLLGRKIGFDTTERVLVEKKIETVKEYCLHTTYDGAAKLPVMTVADMGGHDIDDLASSQPAHVKRRHFSSLAPISPYRAKEVLRDLGLGGSDLNRVTPILTALCDVLMRYDLTFTEINALGRTADGKFYALDAHLDMEAEGFERQKPFLTELAITDPDARGTRPPTPFELEATRIDDEDPRGIISPIAEFDGDMGLVIGAGGGSITTFDAILRHGGKPANYAAIGGNPSVSKAKGLTKLVLQKPGVRKICVISNVVSNTRADLVARGVIKGILELGMDPKETITIFRVPGAWEADAFKILDKYGVEYCDRTVSLSEAARRAVEKAKA
ncbi:MAG TPA: ATP-grasp domain-containing protein [Candidatus Binatia bacterium]|jgi:succinyl-CoA synthetase beta subunit/citryl-CoA synthetase large subunit